MILDAGVMADCSDANVSLRLLTKSPMEISMDRGPHWRKWEEFWHRLSSVGLFILFLLPGGSQWQTNLIENICMCGGIADSAWCCASQSIFLYFLRLVRSFSFCNAQIHPSPQRCWASDPLSWWWPSLWSSRVVRIILTIGVPRYFSQRLPWWRVRRQKHFVPRWRSVPSLFYVGGQVHGAPLRSWPPLGLFYPTVSVVIVPQLSRDRVEVDQVSDSFHKRRVVGVYWHTNFRFKTLRYFFKEKQRWFSSKGRCLL